MMKQIFLFFGLVLISGIAYTSGQPESGSDNQSMEGKPVLHSISSDRVRTIMRQLNEASANEEVTHPELGDMQVVYMDDLLEAVEELVISAEMMQSMSPVPNLDENERVTFRAMASQLYTEALYLKAQAETYDYEGADYTYERLMQTCVACHSLFRDQQ
ncbi:MAG TPA: hypothetical protein VLN56_04540 [Gammaproteobacteria bacterium]|nr:hypothetical protein [Gammaproteobacteria bacterium]